MSNWKSVKLTFHEVRCGQCNEPIVHCDCPIPAFDREFFPELVQEEELRAKLELNNSSSVQSNKRKGK